MVNDEETSTTVALLEGIIPDDYKDEAFKKELEDFSVRECVDVRPYVCGTRLSAQYCKKHNIETECEVATIPPAKHLQAIVNLLQRIGAVAQKDRVEKFTGAQYLDEDEDDKKDGDTTAATGSAENPVGKQT